MGPSGSRSGSVQTLLSMCRLGTSLALEFQLQRLQFMPCKALARFTPHPSSEDEWCAFIRSPSPARVSTSYEESPVPFCASFPIPKDWILNTNALHAFLKLFESPFIPIITEATCPSLSTKVESEVLNVESSKSLL